MPNPMPISPESLESLLESLARIGDRAIRRGVLAERLAELDEQRAAFFLAGICRGASRRDGESHSLVLSLLVDLRTIRARLESQRIQAIRESAASLGLTEVADLLKDGGLGCIQGNIPLPPPVLRGMTLGERRSVAKGPSPRWLERLLQDQDPGVIRNLLRNPRVTESAVLKLASQNPVSQRVLEEVAHAERWISRYRVKLALVLNPCTPQSISMILVGLLMVQDLPQVIERQELSPNLRGQARKLRQERREGLRRGMATAIMETNDT